MRDGILRQGAPVSDPRGPTGHFKVEKLLRPVWRQWVPEGEIGKAQSDQALVKGDCVASRAGEVDRL
jgi:hypothetical protein